jgi:hypothetical protein
MFHSACKSLNSAKQKDLGYDSDETVASEVLSAEAADELLNIQEQNISEVAARIDAVRKKAEERFKGEAAQEYIRRILGICSKTLTGDIDNASIIGAFGEPGGGKTGIPKFIFDELGLKGNFFVIQMSTNKTSINADEILQMVARAGYRSGPIFILIDEAQNARGPNFDYKARFDQLALERGLKDLQAQRSSNPGNAELESRIATLEQEIRTTVGEEQKASSTNVSGQLGFRELARQITGAGGTYSAAKDPGKPASNYVDDVRRYLSNITEDLFRNRTPNEQFKINFSSATWLQERTTLEQEAARLTADRKVLNEKPERTPDEQERLSRLDAELQELKEKVSKLSTKISKFTEYRNAFESTFLDLAVVYPSLVAEMTADFYAKNPSLKGLLRPHIALLALVQEDASRTLELLDKKAKQAPPPGSKSLGNIMIGVAGNLLGVQARARTRAKEEQALDDPDRYLRIYLDEYKKSGVSEIKNTLTNLLGDQENFDSMLSRIGKIIPFRPLSMQEFNEIANGTAETYFQKFLARLNQDQSLQQAGIRVASFKFDPSIAVLALQAQLEPSNGARSLDDVFTKTIEVTMQRAIASLSTSSLKGNLSLLASWNSDSKTVTIEGHNETGARTVLAADKLSWITVTELSSKPLTHNTDIRARVREVATSVTIGGLLFESVPLPFTLPSATEFDPKLFVEDRWPYGSGSSRIHWQYRLKTLVAALASVESGYLDVGQYTPSQERMMTTLKQANSDLINELRQQASIAGIRPASGETLVGAFLRKFLQNGDSVTLLNALAKSDGQNTDAIFTDLKEIVREMVSNLSKIKNRDGVSLVDAIANEIFLKANSRASVEPNTLEPIFVRFLGKDAPSNPPGSATLKACATLERVVLGNRKASLFSRILKSLSGR